MSAWHSLFGAHTSCFVSQPPAVSTVPSPALTPFLQKEDSFLICCCSESFLPTDRNFKGTFFILFPWLNLEPNGGRLLQSIGLLSLAGSKSRGRRSTGAALRLQDFHCSSRTSPFHKLIFWSVIPNLVSYHSLLMI